MTPTPDSPSLIANPNVDSHKVCDAERRFGFKQFGVATSRSLFPAHGLGRVDYVLGITLLGLCFILFYQDDIWVTGWDSLNYLFGSPLEFYENCKKIRGAGRYLLSPYPPPIYIIFAFWLYPLKLAGFLVGPDAFPRYATYWLKVLTTLAYVGSAVIFYRVSLRYVSNREWAKYATTAWLTTPLALFSQFIFSQYDIFYVFLTLTGFLMLLRGRVKLMAISFGLAITFKFFPAFAFLPLLLLYEKRLSRISICCLIFIAPTLLIAVLYGGSPAFVENVNHNFAIDRIYAAAFDIGLSGFWNLYLLPTLYAVLCGLSYFGDVAEGDRARAAAYLLLISSLLPFLLIIWHPQWAMFIAAPIVLTSLILRDFKRFLIFDLIGMFFFVGMVSLTFPGNVDAAMFRGAQFGVEFTNSYWMADIFSGFGSHSLNLFYSGFCAYLILQVPLKYSLLRPCSDGVGTNPIDYGCIRQRFYVGLLLFILPVSYSIYRDTTGRTSVADNVVYTFWSTTNYGTLIGSRKFEQSFVAKGNSISRVSLLLGTPSGVAKSEILLEIIDVNGRIIAKARKTVAGVREIAWHDFAYGSVPVSMGAGYKIRLTSLTTSGDSGIIWWATEEGGYKDGNAIVDDAPQRAEFGFRITFRN